MQKLNQKGQIDITALAFIVIFFVGGFFAPWYGQYTKAFLDALPGLPLRAIFEFILNGAIGDAIGLAVWKFFLKLF